MRFSVCLLVVLLVLPAISTATGVVPPAEAAAAGEPVYYFLKTEGEAHYLYRVALNGKTALGGPTLISMDFPAYVGTFLKEGQNVLEVEYTSDTTQGLTVLVEARTKGPRRAELARLSSVPGATGGKRVTRALTFTAHVNPPAPVHLTDADRREILAVLQAYHDTLAHRDSAGYRRLYARAIEEDRQIYPELTDGFQSLVDASFRLISNPQFQMKPFQPAGLQFTVLGHVVQISRPGQAPVVESGPVEVKGTTTITVAGQTVQQTTLDKEYMRPRTLEFTRYDGKWFLALPYGF